MICVIACFCSCNIDSDLTMMINIRLYITLFWMSDVRSWGTQCEIRTYFLIWDSKKYISGQLQPLFLWNIKSKNQIWRVWWYDKIAALQAFAVLLNLSDFASFFRMMQYIFPLTCHHELPLASLSLRVILIWTIK